MARLVILALFIFLTRRSIAIPMSAQCTSPEVLKVSLASKLELKCVSPCDSELPQKYEWVKVSEGGTENQLDVQDQVLIVKSVGLKDRGTYKCRCLKDGTWCKQTVHVQSRSILEFTTSHNYITSEENAKLLCKVTAPAEEKPLFPVIERLQTKEILHTSTKNEDDQTFVSWVVVPNTKIPKEDFICYVDAVDKVGEVIERLKKNLTIHTHKYAEPPEVDQVNNAVIGKDDIGGTCEIACIVLTSPQVDTKVTWHRNKDVEELPAGKYSTRVEDTSEAGTFRYVLQVKNLQMSDIGQYSCKVSSQFSGEDQRTVLIELKDEETAKIPGHQESEDGAKIPGHQESEDGGKRKGGFPTSITVIVLILVVGAIIWRCFRWRKRKYEPYNNGSLGFTSSADSGFQGDEMNAFRRKYKLVE